MYNLQINKVLRRIENKNLNNKKKLIFGLPSSIFRKTFYRVFLWRVDDQYFSQIMLLYCVSNWSRKTRVIKMSLFHLKGKISEISIVFKPNYVNKSLGKD